VSSDLSSASRSDLHSESTASDNTAPRAHDLRADLEAVVRGLVDHPEAVSVAEFRSPEEILFEVSVGQGDVGKVIGRQGRTIRALRTVLAARPEAIPHAFELVED
jgi:uncharacterized protein